MKIILTNCIKIENPTKEMKDLCKKELTFKNPQYDKMRRMGYWAYGTPKEIKLYDEYEGNLYCPMGFFDKLFRFYPVPKDYTDYSVEVPIDIKSNIKLRDYQELAVPSVGKYKCGIINIPVGLRQN